MLAEAVAAGLHVTDDARFVHSSVAGDQSPAKPLRQVHTKSLGEVERLRAMVER